MPFIERIFVSLVLGVIGIVIGLLLGATGIPLIMGYPSSYVLGISFALVGLLWGTSILDWVDIFDWFSS